MSAPAETPSGKLSAGEVVLSAGLIAGVLDIAYVIIVYGFRGVAAERILKGIAAAVLGPEAHQGRWGIAMLGLGLHFTVALTAATVFYALSRKLRFLTKFAVPSGIAYGGAVWLVMNLLVLPLTATPPKVFPPPGWPIILFAHLVCVGLPIALVVRRNER